MLKERQEIAALFLNIIFKTLYQSGVLFLTLLTERMFCIIILRGDSMNYNIPQGRGMIKWAPFATMPEQFENVRKLNENNTHVPVPNLSNDLQQELELKLRELVGQNVILRYWNAGHEFQEECELINVDEWSRYITVLKNDAVSIVHFDHIYGVDEYDYLAKLD